jgi:hypothetical protein
MAETKLSFKKLKELHRTLGGNQNGFFITTYGVDEISGKTIRIEERIAKFVRPNASADVYLVKGTYYK